MCRMLAFAATEPRDVAPYVVELRRVSIHGNLMPQWERRPGGNHPDGWGVAWSGPGATEMEVVRSGRPAGDDPHLAGIRARATRFMGHVRYASDTGTINAANAHPFRKDGIVMAHNGTFRGKIGEDASARGVSDTLVFLERLAASWTVRTLSGLRDVLSKTLADRDLVGEYSAANLLIASGQSLFALRRFRKTPDYYTLHLRAAPGCIAVASEPFGGETSGWRLMSDGELAELSLPVPRSALLEVGAVRS